MDGGCKRWCQNKKLTLAAQYWAAGSASADNAGVETALDVFGITTPEAAEWLAQINPVIEKQDFEVLPENLMAVQVFLAMQTNWRVIAGMAGIVWQGLDYSALPAVFQLMAIPKKQHPALFQDLRLMEAEAVPILNKK
ncbi:MAG: hypothetical protein RL018_1710 [Pseudomonadota bacterium]